MKTDYNKSISSITFNFLNLPNVVTITGKGTITYTYDASGNKLQKTTLDLTITPNKTTNYYYARDYVYRNDTLEFISHPEGRLRPLRIDTTQAISISNLKYIYDYFLKDHLGSVRTVLTTEQETDIYAATMETATAAKENLLFNNMNSAIAKPGGFDTNSSNGQVSQLNGDPAAGNYKRVGPSIVMKVMAGDTISIAAYGWYTGGVQAPPVGPSTVINDILPFLLTSIGGQGGSKGGSIPATTSTPLITGDLTNFLTTQSQPTNYDNSRPKAFLNWMVVDEEFAAVSSPNHIGTVQMPSITGSMPAQQMPGPVNMVIRKSGWIYIYLSNESKQTVYFDNLVINYKRGPLVEQKDYYAFGMEIPGLCTKAIKNKYDENRNKFNGIEFDSAFGFNEYEAKYRDYDPQIGRFIQIDPKVESAESWSVYSAMLDNPIRFTDPLGDSTIPGAGFWANAWEGVKDGMQETAGFVKSLGTKEGWQNLGNNVVDLVDRSSPMSPTGMAKNAQTAANVVAAVENIPNMTKDDIGHALGYGAEKVGEAVVLSKGAGAVAKVAEGAETQTVYRVFGGDAKASGFSYTPTNPNTVENFRDAAGLPSGGASGANNTGRFVIEGTVKNKNIIKQNPAAALDGNKGGLQEYIISPKNVNVKRVSGANPNF